MLRKRSIFASISNNEKRRATTRGHKTQGETHGQGTAFRQTRPHQGVYACAGRLHQRCCLRRFVGAQGALEARPQPDHGGRAGRDLPAGATRVASDARDRQWRHAGRDHRSHHPHGVLCGLAGRDVGGAGRLHACWSKATRGNEDGKGCRCRVCRARHHGWQDGHQYSQGRIQGRGARSAPAVGQPSFAGGRRMGGYAARAGGKIRRDLHLAAGAGRCRARRARRRWPDRRRQKGRGLF